MPMIDNAKAPTFDIIEGVRFTPVASPSRGSGETAVWRTRVLPGTPGAVHHMTREEIIVATAGVGRLTIGAEARTLKPGDAFAVPAFLDFKLESANEHAFEAMVVLPAGGRAVIGDQPSFQPPWSI